MSGRIVIVQRAIALDYSNFSGTYDYVHARGLDLVTAREIVLAARVTQRSIGAGATPTLSLHGFYPDQDDAGDVLGTALAGMTIDLGTNPTSTPGVATVTTTNNIPRWLRVITTFRAPSASLDLLVKLSIQLVL